MPPARRTRTAKRRGADTQTLVAEWYRRLWPAATSLGSGEAGRDIQNVPVDIEVKGRKDFDPLTAMKQLQERGRREEDQFPGHVVIRPFRMGEAHLPDWLVIRRLEDDTELLKEILSLRRQVQFLGRELQKSAARDVALLREQALEAADEEERRAAEGG